MVKIAKTKGQNSQGEKEAILLELLRAAKGEEPKYIVRFIQKNLKIGAAELTMQSALARAFVLTSADGKHLNYKRESPTNFDKLV